MTDDKIEKLIRELLDTVRGETTEREGLVKTPHRVAEAFRFSMSGYDKNPREVLRSAIFSYEGSEMIIVKNIEFYSLCEHHLLPFFGHVSIAYLPKGEMVGLSKLARVVEIFARRLQVQERMTRDICLAIADGIANDGVIVRVEARHLCMQMRGVEKADPMTVTIDSTGRFTADRSLREEFLSLLPTME